VLAHLVALHGGVAARHQLCVEIRDIRAGAPELHLLRDIYDERQQSHHATEDVLDADTRAIHSPVEGLLHMRASDSGEALLTPSRASESGVAIDAEQAPA